jgi:transposase
MKYTEEFKLTVVKDYLVGSGGYKAIAKKYNISAFSIVRNWVRIYRSQGAEGLKNKLRNAEYSVEFKLEVIYYYLNGEVSYTDTATHFGINNPSTICLWLKNFNKYGIEGLLKPRGRPSMTKEKTAKKQTTNREKQLEEENELLKIQVAYLKKLQALGMKLPDRLTKEKQ